jgi:hypothetical protein
MSADLIAGQQAIQSASSAATNRPSAVGARLAQQSEMIAVGSAGLAGTQVQSTGNVLAQLVLPKMAKAIMPLVKAILPK